MEIHPLRKFEKTLQCKSDKSVTHRAVMFNAMLTGARATVENPLISEDTLSTVECMRRLGADIEVGGNEIRIINGGIRNNAELDCGNSGTTMRLLAGLLSGRVGKSFYLGGDASLSARPMKRVVEPLGRMGAKIECSGFPPLSISGAPLVGIDYEMPVKSAQVKSAILLAALNASGVTTVHESTKSREHTEKMLAAMGADKARARRGLRRVPERTLFTLCLLGGGLGGVLGMKAFRHKTRHRKFALGFPLILAGWCVLLWLLMFNKI